MLDRVFDNYVMTPMQEIVAEHIRSPGQPDAATVGNARQTLDKSYAWLEAWLGRTQPRRRIGLIECAAAPALFYADWVHPIPVDCVRLGEWRAQLLALPAVKRCVDEARPFRHYFPLGAPERD
jgi:glutathione S-transferase